MGLSYLTLDRNSMKRLHYMHVARWGCYLGGFVIEKKNVTFFLPQNSLFRLKSPNVLCKQKGKKTKASALDFLCGAFYLNLSTCLATYFFSLSTSIRWRVFSFVIAQKSESAERLTLVHHSKSWKSGGKAQNGKQ